MQTMGIEKKVEFRLFSLKKVYIFICRLVYQFLFLIFFRCLLMKFGRNYILLNSDFFYFILFQPLGQLLNIPKSINPGTSRYFSQVSVFTGTSPCQQVFRPSSVFPRTRYSVCSFPFCVKKISTRFPFVWIPLYKAVFGSNFPLQLLQLIFLKRFSAIPFLPSTRKLSTLSAQPSNMVAQKRIFALYSCLLPNQLSIQFSLLISHAIPPRLYFSPVKIRVSPDAPQNQIYVLSILN